MADRGDESSKDGKVAASPSLATSAPQSPHPMSLDKVRMPLLHARVLSGSARGVLVVALGILVSWYLGILWCGLTLSRGSCVDEDGRSEEASCACAQGTVQALVPDTSGTSGA